jgi:hypothetical protein
MGLLYNIFNEISTTAGVGGYTVPLGMKAPSQKKLRKRWQKYNKKGMNMFKASADDKNDYEGKPMVVRRRFANLKNESVNELYGPNRTINIEIKRCDPSVSRNITPWSAR